MKVTLALKTYFAFIVLEYIVSNFSFVIFNFGAGKILLVILLLKIYILLLKYWCIYL